MPESLRRDLERALEECQERNERMAEALREIQGRVREFWDGGTDPHDAIRTLYDLAKAALIQD